METAGYFPSTIMELFDAFFYAALVAVIAFQVWLTVRVFRTKTFERKQQILQAQLIWLVPIIGAGLVFTILQEEDRATGKTPPSALS